MYNFVMISYNTIINEVSPNEVRQMKFAKRSSLKEVRQMNFRQTKCFKKKKFSKKKCLVKQSLVKKGWLRVRIGAINAK